MIEFDNPPTVRGVNLGGWFVLEGWMSPSLFTGVTGVGKSVIILNLL